jgi:hypothetical protein
VLGAPSGGVGGIDGHDHGAAVCGGNEALAGLRGWHLADRLAADRLEHVISEELEERIDQALGYPTHDPHGDPIPDANLEWPAERRE